MDFVSFFEGTGTDDKGRYIYEIKNYSDEYLEKSHDIIQRIFPLKERSRAQPDSPVITEDQINNIKKSKEAMLNFIDVIHRMMWFYGFSTKMIDGKIHFVYSHEWDEKKKKLLTPRNHNYLRITRIMKCCCLLGLNDVSIALMALLDDIYNDNKNMIGIQTYYFWKDASEGK